MNKEFTIEAKVEYLPDILADVEEAMEENGWGMDKITSYAICAEEIFVNVASYAYSDGYGDVTIIENIDKDKVELTFIDSGIQYNPLQKPDPDVTLSAEERQIGGLGIFMVKKMMSSVDYKYSDGKNHFTMTLNRE